jgi:hypothetical protein
MKHKTLRFGGGFNVVLGNRAVPGGQMVLDPGIRRKQHHRTLAPTNGCSSWQGLGSRASKAALQVARRQPFLIERGDRHEIVNTGVRASRPSTSTCHPDTS